MSQQNAFGYSLVLSLAVLAAACGDDARNSGSGSASASGTADETASDSDSDSMTDSAEGAEQGMEQGGDGDGDSPGDGDGDSAGDGDGDSSGDGDGDSSGDGDGDSGDGDGDSGDGDGASGDGDGDACMEYEAMLAPIPPSVMFLLDRSGSMNTTGFDMNDPGKSRWGALWESVEAVVGNGADATIAFGAKTFSTYNFGECGVSDAADVPIALNNGAAVLAGIPGPMEMIVGGTPTNLAIEKTNTIMQAHDAMGGSKVVFLVTDGAIACTNNHAQALADAVADLSAAYANDGITTYVVGIAPSGSNQILNQLQQMAIAGGAPKQGNEAFYRADDAQELSDALAAIVADSVNNSCTIALEQPPQFPDFTKVWIGNTKYSLVQDCANEDGFVYSQMDYSEIELCGTACEDLHNEGSALVQYFCTPT